MSAGDEASGPSPLDPVFAPRTFEASTRKFSAYVLAPGHQLGKDRIFIDLLGFRPRHSEDAQHLANLYLARARAAILARDYDLVTPFSGFARPPQ